jgi:hypothetical protein
MFQAVSPPIIRNSKTVHTASGVCQACLLLPLALAARKQQATSALNGAGGKRHAEAALPPGKTRCPLYRRLVGPQGRSGQVRKISPTPEFDPRTVQPVASRYTDCALPAPHT